MTWILFVFGMFAAWIGVASDNNKLIGVLFQFLFLIVGGCTMIGAMYLRSIGW